MMVMMVLVLMVNALMKPHWLLLLSCAALQSTAEVADRFDAAPGACPPLCYCTDRGNGSSHSSYVSVDFGPVSENPLFGDLWLWRMVLVLFPAKKLLFLLPPPPSFPAGNRRTEAWTNGSFRSRPPTSPPVVRFFIHVHQLFTFRATLHFEVGVRPPNLNRHYIIPMSSVWAH